MKSARIVTFFQSSTSSALIFAWSLAEGLFFFIVPDVYLGISTLFAPKSAPRNLRLSLLGSLMSATIFSLLIQFHFPAESFILHVPGISTQLLAQVRSLLEQHGSMAVVQGPTSGIPYKVYAVESAQLQLPFVSFLFWSIVSRLTRLLPVTLGAWLVGTFCKRSLERYWGAVILVYAFLWIVVYYFYFLKFGV